MYHITRSRLLSFTDPVEFQRLVLDVLSCTGYHGIDPQSPGLPDGGKDGLIRLPCGENIVVACSLQARWKPKFKSDLAVARSKWAPLRRFLFCSNRNIPALERDRIRRVALGTDGLDVDFYDGERLRVALDTVCKDIRQTYLGIQDNSTERRLLRFILLDPYDEVEALHPWRLESFILTPPLARGVFHLLRGVDLFTVCESLTELQSLSQIIETYFQFRTATCTAERHVLRLVKAALPTERSHVVWNAIAGYCFQRLLGRPEKEAVESVLILGVCQRGEACREALAAVSADGQTAPLLGRALEMARACRDSSSAVLQVPSLTMPPPELTQVDRSVTYPVAPAEDGDRA